MATLRALGGTAPYTFTLAKGTLPAGLALSPSGQITGTLETAGSDKITINVADSSSPALIASRTFTVRIAKAETTTTLKLSATKVGYGHEQTELISVTVAPQYSGQAPAGKVTINASETNHLHYDPVLKPPRHCSSAS
jgi:hypothetical protein